MATTDRFTQTKLYLPQSLVKSQTDSRKKLLRAGGKWKAATWPIKTWIQKSSFMSDYVQNWMKGWIKTDKYWLKHFHSRQQQKIVNVQDKRATLESEISQKKQTVNIIIVYLTKVWLIRINLSSERVDAMINSYGVLYIKPLVCFQNHFKTNPNSFFLDKF